MKQLRKIIFWCHLVAGVVAGIIILIMSTTGVLLTYEKQVEWWADTRGYHVAQPTPDSGRLSVEELLGKIRVSQSLAPTAVTFYRAGDSPAVVSFPGGKLLYIDPYTGDIFGEGSPGVHAFFSVVTNWHRWLGASGDNRAVGRAITGASNLLFLFIVMSGFYLWWPRKWTRKSLRAVTWFRTGQKGRARDFNWHNVIGFWSVIPLFVLVLSGVVISYTWASNLVYRIAGEEPPAQQQRGGTPGGGASQLEASAVPLEGLELLMARAELQVKGWRSITLQIPQKPDVPVTFAIDRGNGGQPQLRSQLTLNRATGEVVRWEPYTSYTTGRRLRAWFRFAHTGEFYGFVGQTIAGIATLGAVFLVVTGLSLAWRRFYSWRVRRSMDLNEGSSSTD